MERFVTRHQGRIAGILTGCDRTRFRGTLRGLSYRQGVEIWLSRRGIQLKEFARFAAHLGLSHAAR